MRHRAGRRVRLAHGIRGDTRIRVVVRAAREVVAPRAPPLAGVVAVRVLRELVVQVLPVVARHAGHPPRAREQRGDLGARGEDQRQDGERDGEHHRGRGEKLGGAWRARHHGVCDVGDHTIRSISKT